MTDDNPMKGIGSMKLFFCHWLLQGYVTDNRHCICCTLKTLRQTRLRMKKHATPKVTYFIITSQSKSNHNWRLGKRPALEASSCLHYSAAAFLQEFCLLHVFIDRVWWTVQMGITLDSISLLTEKMSWQCDKMWRSLVSTRSVVITKVWHQMPCQREAILAVTLERSVWHYCDSVIQYGPRAMSLTLKLALIIKIFPIVKRAFFHMSACTCRSLLREEFYDFWIFPLNSLIRKGMVQQF